MADNEYNADAYHYLNQRAEDQRQEQIDKANRILALRNRSDFVSRNRIVNEGTASMETRAEIREEPAAQQVPGRRTTGAVITETPDVLHDVLMGGMRVNPRSMVSIPSKNNAFSNPRSMINIMAGSPAKQPQVRTSGKKDMPVWLQEKIAGKKAAPRDKIGAFSSMLLGRKRK